jgi:hydroxymethylglutaryl-CoA lyase
MTMPDRVTIVEVGPRDGLQNESTQVDAAVKIELIERLAACGLPEVEATSFVSPTAVPQLADATQVMKGIHRNVDTLYPALVPNLRGYDMAVTAGASYISIFTAASEGFAAANLNTSIAGSFERFEQVLHAAQRDRVKVRGYISTAFGCPFDGEVHAGAVVGVAQRMLELGVRDLSIGDTIGVAAPTDIERVCAPLLDLDGIERLALHLHDTRGTALANAWAGLQLGISTFDSSVAGLGGCPFAPGATGNLATEDLVWMLERCGIDTGVDWTKLVATSRWISDQLGRTPQSHTALAPVWPPA